MYKNKEVKVVFSEKANSVYEGLNKVVGDEIKNKINS
jgi:hypothetical protein